MLNGEFLFALLALVILSYWAGRIHERTILSGRIHVDEQLKNRAYLLYELKTAYINLDEDDKGATVQIQKENWYKLRYSLLKLFRILND